VPHEKFAMAHLVAAQAYTKKDRLDQAAEEYKLFLKESPDSPNAASARATLQSIQSHQK
jgi:outer membrane protein assembly factor BamD (BamD/ComL family)